MTDHVTALTPGDIRASAMMPTPRTRTLMVCGIAAGPLFMLAAVIQAFTRHGFGISWHGALHFAGSGARFLCLIAACFVIAHRASTLGQRGWVGRSIPGPSA